MYSSLNVCAIYQPYYKLFVVIALLNKKSIVSMAVRAACFSTFFSACIHRYTLKYICVTLRNKEGERGRTKYVPRKTQ